MRVFLAVFPPSAAQDVAHAAIEALRRPGDGVSWVRRENLHYTLRFLGEIGADGARRAGEAAREAAGALAPFDAALGACGAFPAATRARVLWIGLARGAGPFVALARALEAALERRGFAPERRPFSPHLTIGRVRAERADWSERLPTVPDAAARPEAAFRVERVQVVESELHPQGSIYRTLDEAALGG